MKKLLLAGALVLLPLSAQAQDNFDWIKQCTYAIPLLVQFGHPEMLPYAAHPKEICTKLYHNRNASPEIHMLFVQLTDALKEVNNDRNHLNTLGIGHLPSPEDE